MRIIATNPAITVAMERFILASVGTVMLIAAGCGDDGGSTQQDAGVSQVDANDPSQPDAGPPGSLVDTFDGTGPLVGYTVNNENALPEVGRVDGRYRANLLDNTGNITLHFNDDQGRLDAKLVAFPFDIVVRNIGIGTQLDSQTAPLPTSDPYVFSGIQVHVTDLQSRNSSHIVVGHRGGTHYTVEGKNTRDGSSSVNDVGANTVPAGRADIRVEGNGDRTLTIHWQPPNPAPGTTADNWNLYGGDGQLPGTAPDYGASVYVGLITYAFNENGVPFVGTADAIEHD